MMRVIRVTISCVAVALIFSAGLYLSRQTSTAQEAEPVPSALTIIEVNSGTIADPVTITAKLTDAWGQDVGASANEALELFLEGEKIYRVRTEPDGTAELRMKAGRTAGTYPVKILYFGSKSLGPSMVNIDIVIEPITLEIVTVPPVDGVRFTLEDREFTSNNAGVARIDVEELGEYRLEVHPVDTETRALTFNRWRDEVFEPTRTIDIKRDQYLEVGFDTSYKVNTAYYDLEGLAVDPDRIARVVLRSSHGTEAVLEAPDLGTAETGSIWFQAGRVVRRFHGLEETPILWSVDSVEIDGTSVVNRAQQRFFVEENDLWEIVLLLYEAHFSARDALFGFPLGDGVNLEYPNGTLESIDFESNNQVKVASLPRGEYRVNVAGAPGYSPYSPVALSRNQDVHLLVISYIDMAVAAGLLVLLAVGLVVIGRPSLLRYVRLSGGSARYRRAFVVVAAVTLLTGVAILSFGLGKDPPNLSAQPLGTPGIGGDTDAAALPEFTTGDADEQEAPRRWSSAVGMIDDESILWEERPEIPITGVFQSFWDRNGAFGTFGPPVAPAVKRRDPETGLMRISQHFKNATLEFDEQRAGSPTAIQLRDLGAIDAEMSGYTDLEAFQPPRDQPGPEGECRYFEETDHYACGEFLAYWYASGLTLTPHATSFQESLALFGYPISEAFEDPETGRTVQYFERVRLELFPEHSGTSHVVQQADLKGAQK